MNLESIDERYISIRPYLLPELDRLLPVLKAFDLNLIVPEVHERLSEEEILLMPANLTAPFAVMTAIPAG